jgi:hypothetical protein
VAGGIQAWIDDALIESEDFGGDFDGGFRWCVIEYDVAHLFAEDA